MQSTEQIKEDLNNLVNLGIQIVRGDAFGMAKVLPVMDKKGIAINSPFFVYVIPRVQRAPWENPLDRYYCPASWSPPVLTSSSYP